MSEPTGIRIADSHWLLDGRHYRFTVAQLSADALTPDQRAVGLVMHGDGTVGIGIVTPKVAASITLTLAEAHELGQALLSLEPRDRGPFESVNP
jgi:hypothetical protein